MRRNRANHESGSFAVYAIAKAAVQRKIPYNMSFEEAATLGVAIMTVVSQTQAKKGEREICIYDQILTF